MGRTRVDEPTSRRDTDSGARRGGMTSSGQFRGQWGNSQRIVPGTSPTPPANRLHSRPITAEHPTAETSLKNDYDSPWKEALKRFFPEFLALLFPAIHAQIDWRVAPEFLDKELQQVGADSPRGRRYADKLVRVHACDGRKISGADPCRSPGRLRERLWRADVYLPDPAT